MDNSKGNLTNQSKTSKNETTGKNGRHSVKVAGTNFEMDERYEFMKQIGIGSYSIVCSCYDKKENRNVAIKKITNAFDNLQDARRIYREMKMLRFFNHDNIIPPLFPNKSTNLSISSIQNIK